MQPPTDDPELTIPEIIDRYPVSRAYARLLQRIAGTEKLPARKPGRDWLIRRSAIEHWLNTKPPAGRPRKQT